MKKIIFVVLHYRDVANTKACIKSLCELTPVKGYKVETLVVDNKSPDPFPTEKIVCAIGETTILHNQENLGYTGGMNSGIVAGLSRGGDFICVVNNDTVFDKEFLRASLARLEKEKDLGILVPKIYFYKGTEYHRDRYKESELGKIIWYAGGHIDWKNVYASHRGVDEVDKGQYDQVSETSFATGCCMIFPKEALQKTGYFDDAYYLYYEDIDLSMRMKQKGFKICFEPRAVLWHKNAKSAGGAGSLLQDYYISRNRMIFSMRYAPLRAKAAVVREGIRLLASGREWQKKGVTDFFLRKFGKGSFIVS